MAGVVGPNTLCWDAYMGRLSVTCQGLTPGVTYRTSAGTFTADRFGKGKGKTNRFGFSYVYDWDQWVGVGELLYEPSVGVSRVNSDASETLVLAGWFE